MSDGNIGASIDAYNTSLDISFGEVYEVDKGLPVGVLANLYSPTQTYALGDYVIYKSKLYRCIIAVEEPEEFDIEKWTQVKLADDVQDLAESLDSKADKSTTYTKSEVDEIAATKANTSDVEGALASKADKSTTYTKTEADNKFATNSDLGEFIGLVDGELDKKADKYNTYTKSEVDEIAIGKANTSDVETALAQKADKEDTYTKSQVDSALSLKANSSNVYTKSQTYTKDETDDKLDLKADKSTTYTKTEIDTKFANLPNPMIFKGTLGENGTISELPAPSASNEGWTYKVITAGTYSNLDCKVGDVVVSIVTEWTLIPAGDEDSDTWRALKVNGTEKLTSGISSGDVDFVDTDNIEVTFDTTGNKVKIATKNIYTQTQVDTALGNKANSSDVYTKSAVDTSLAAKVDKNNPVITGSLDMNKSSSYNLGNYSAAIGYMGRASGYVSTSIGMGNKSIGTYSTAIGYGSLSSGTASTAIGDHVDAKNRAQLVFGQYNISDPSTTTSSDRGTYIEIVGNGAGLNIQTLEEERSNARTLDWQGNETLAGDLTYNGNKSLTSEISRLDGRIDNLPSPTVITGTLVAGQTSLTLQSVYITTNSMIEIFTSDGTEWNNITVTDGQIVITFYAQASDLGVKVRVS